MTRLDRFRRTPGTPSNARETVSPTQTALLKTFLGAAKHTIPPLPPQLDNQKPKLIASEYFQSCLNTAINTSTPPSVAPIDVGAIGEGDVGPSAKRGIRRGEFSHLRENCLPCGVRQGGDEADRGDAVLHCLGREALDVGEFRFLERTKQRRRLEGFLPAKRFVTRRRTFKRLDDLRQAAQPACRFVAGVPDQAESPARLEDAMNFGKRLRAAKPVEGLRRNHGVDTGVRKRNRLGCAVDDRDVGQPLAKLVAHGLDRLDRDDLRPGRRQRPRELSGSGSQFHHARSGTDLERLDQALNGRRRVIRPSPLVRRRGPLEADGRLLVDGDFAIHADSVGMFPFYSGWDNRLVADAAHLIRTKCVSPPSGAYSAKVNRIPPAGRG